MTTLISLVDAPAKDIREYYNKLMNYVHEVEGAQIQKIMSTKNGTNGYDNTSRRTFSPDIKLSLNGQVKPTDKVDKKEE